ncbi:MAG: hypothetical protein KDE56_16080 [Anaerolineales bacterium]|nr:hypothetical protein [Anaerolineales bacterium]
MGDREGNVLGFLISAFAVGVLVVGWFLFNRQLILGVQAGLVVGVIVGSIFWPVVRTPDLGGRALMGAFIGVLLILLFEALQIGNVLRGFNFFTLAGASSLLGGTVYGAIIRILQAAYIGAAFAILLVAPTKFVLGALVGTLVAAAIGGVGIPLLALQGVVLQQEVAWLGIGLLTLVLFIVFDTS